MSGYGFYRYDVIWSNIARKYGWDPEDGAGDYGHWEAMTDDERASLSDAFAADMRSGAHEMEY